MLKISIYSSTFYINDVLLFKCPFPGPKGQILTWHYMNEFDYFQPNIPVLLVTLFHCDTQYTPPFCFYVLQLNYYQFHS